MSRSCLGLGDPFFTLTVIFIVVNRITSFKQTYLFSAHFLKYLLSFLLDNVDEETE